MSVKILIILGILVSSLYIYYTVDRYKDELYKEFYVASVEPISYTDPVVVPEHIEKEIVTTTIKKDIKKKYDIELEIEMALRDIIPSKIIKIEGEE